IGDELEDLTVSHFQEGDAGYGGYTYTQQMLPLGARLNYLQLRREIPFGLDTMGLMPIEFTLYIDTPEDSIPNCIDCDFYGVNSSNFRTMLKLQVASTDTLFSYFVDFIMPGNRLL